MQSVYQCIHHSFLSFILWLPSQAESDEFGVRLAEQSVLLQKTEELSEERGQQVDELQRLLASMEIEYGHLKDKMAAGEAELLQLKEGRNEGGEKEQRWDERQRDELEYNHWSK